jgi:signal transduction histidine kinase
MMISGQPSQLETIVLDLASNAFDSMRGTNGRLLIRLAGKTVEREITGFPNSVLPGHYAYLQIKDSGTGMDKETLQKAFDPFFTTKPDGFGTGLGLANVEGIISTHQGFIQVDSSAGKGTTFHLYFPLIDSGDE